MYSSIIEAVYDSICEKLILGTINQDEFESLCADAWTFIK